MTMIVGPNCVLIHLPLPLFPVPVWDTWGRKEGRTDGQTDGQKEGRKERRKDGRKEGRKEGRKKEREEGRKEQRKEGETLFGNRQCGVYVAVVIPSACPYRHPPHSLLLLPLQGRVLVEFHNTPCSY